MNLTSTHLAMDTETLGVTDNAIITSIAVTPFKLIETDITFDELLERTFFVKLKAKTQNKLYGRVAEKSTLAWWAGQSAETKQYSFKSHVDDVHPKEALIELNRFIKSTDYEWNSSYVFERGMGFDTTKMQSLYTQCDVKIGFNFWRAREIRTINDLIGDVSNGKWEPNEGRPANFIEHHAKHDAAMDAYRLIKLFDL